MADSLTRLGEQAEEVIAALDRVGAHFALIGGLALAPHKVIRAAQDVPHVVSAEALIAFKLQGWVNNPQRTRDLEDIRALIRANRNQLDLVEARKYFRMCDRESLLEELLNEPQ